MKPEEFLERRPKSVAFVGLGPSANAFWLLQSQFDEKQPDEEVWAINRAAKAFTHDVAFNMHDLRMLVKEHPKEWELLALSGKPIVTIKAYPEFPVAVEYPIGPVLEFLREDFLNSTPAYMVAYAMMIGVKEIWLFGCDFHYRNMDRAELGGQGMAFLLGMARMLGIEFKIPSSSSLLAAYTVRMVDGVPMRPLYGYSDKGETRDPRIKEDSKIVVVTQPEESMSARQKPYALGEADEGDKVTPIAEEGIPGKAAP